MEEQKSTFTSVLREDSFEVVVRGYNRRQVHEYMAKTRRQVRDLEERLTRAQEGLESTRHELEDARQQHARPAHEEVSERLSQILQLADEEADQRRAAADADVARLRELAEQDAQRIVDQASAQAEQIMTNAREESDRDLAGAREEAKRLITSSTEESHRTVSNAQGAAQELLDHTSRRANAINDVLARRLAALTSTHQDALRRLIEMRDTIAELVGADTAAGPLLAEVETAMGQPLESPAAPVAAEGSTDVPVPPSEGPSEEPDRVLDLTALEADAGAATGDAANGTPAEDVGGPGTPMRQPADQEQPVPAALAAEGDSPAGSYPQAQQGGPRD